MSKRQIQSRIFRSPHDSDNKYTKISNELIRDSKLSFKARGLMCYILSSRDDFGLNPKAIAISQGVGEERIYSGLKELINAGYCKRTCFRDPNGRVTMWSYEISESKRFKNDSTDSFQPEPQNPDLENPDLDNADYKKNCSKRSTDVKEQTNKELVCSFEQEKLELLRPFNLKSINLKHALSCKIEDLRVSLAAYLQWVQNNGPRRDPEASLMTAIRQKWVPNEEKGKKEAEEQKAKEELLLKRKSMIEKLIKNSDLPFNYSIRLSETTIIIRNQNSFIPFSYLDEFVIDIIENHLKNYDRKKM